MIYSAVADDEILAVIILYISRCGEISAAGGGKESAEFHGNAAPCGDGGYHCARLGEHRHIAPLGVVAEVIGGQTGAVFERNARQPEALLERIRKLLKLGKLLFDDCELLFLST